MKSSKAKKTDLDRIVSRILQTPPKDKFDDYEYTDKIFGFDYDGFLDSKLDEVDPQTSEEYEFDKIYKSFDEFKRDYPQEAKDLFAWHPKGGEFLFNRNKQGSDFDGIMVKFKPIK